MPLPILHKMTCTLYSAMLQGEQVARGGAKNDLRRLVSAVLFFMVFCALSKHLNNCTSCNKSSLFSHFPQIFVIVCLFGPVNYYSNVMLSSVGDRIMRASPANKRPPVLSVSRSNIKLYFRHQHSQTATGWIVDVS